MWYISSVLITARLQLYVAASLSERIGMEMVKIEQVIVGSDVRSTSAEIKSEPEVAPVQSCKSK